MSFDKLSPQELNERYETLTRRIDALNTDVARTLDSEQKLVLQQRLDDAVKERGEISAKLGKPRVNGDLDKLRSKIDELAVAIETNNPVKTHSVITECYNIFLDLDDRVVGLEQWREMVDDRLDPPLIVMVWRAVAALTILVGVLVFAVPFFNYAFFSVWWVGAFIEIAVVSIAVLFWWISRLSAAPKQATRGRHGR